jgi:hypothetical protein
MDNISVPIRRNLINYIETCDLFVFYEHYFAQCFNEMLRIRSLQLHPLLKPCAIRLGIDGFCYSGKSNNTKNHSLYISCYFCYLEIEIKVSPTSVLDLGIIINTHKKFQTQDCVNKVGNEPLVKIAQTYKIFIPKCGEFPMQELKTSSQNKLHTTLEELSAHNSPDAICKGCLTVYCGRLLNAIMHPCGCVTCGWCLQFNPISNCLLCDNKITGYSNLYLS